MNDNDMHELNLDDLNTITGGDKLMWQALYVIFNGNETFDEKKIANSYRLRDNLAKKIKSITGIEVDFMSKYDVNRDVVFKMNDGTILNEEQFLDYIKATYTMDEILSWHSM